MALQITDANFEELVNSGKPMVLDFWAEWCGPCRMVGPIIDELATEYEGRVTIGKMDVDNNNDVVAQFGIRNIPTVLFFKDGKVVDKQVGAAPKLHSYLKSKLFYNLIARSISRFPGGPGILSTEYPASFIIRRTAPFAQ